MPGRHRNGSRAKAIRLAAAAVVVLSTVAAGAWVVGNRTTEKSCDGTVRFAVGATAEIAPALRSAAAAWAKDAVVGGKCVIVDVAAQAPADVAAAVAAERGVSVLGLGKANGNLQIPQVWVPDSSLWRLRLQAVAKDFQPSDATSIAASPVVLAVPQPMVSGLNASGTELTWDTLLRQAQTGSTLTAGVVEPTQDTAGLLGLLSFAGAAAKLGAQAQAATVAALRLVARGSSAVREDLLSRFPQALDADTIAASLTAGVVPEQAVLQYNAASPPIPLAALYVSPQPTALDYPFLVMPGVDPAVAEAAAGLRAALKAESFRNALAQQGLRGPDGVGGAGFAYPSGAPTPAASADQSGGSVAANLSAVEQVLSAWLALTQPGRILAVLDVSGSMLTKVPTAGNRTREQVTVEAAVRGLELFDDSWDLGLWIFSTNLDGDRDQRELLPISPMSAIRERAVQSLSGVQPKKNGDTGLYDTVLAAYRKLQDNWVAGRLNTVVIMTDGDNDDDNSVSLSALQSQLQQLKDPRRPVDIVFIGIGPDVSQGPLQQIVATIGGGVFTAPDPADIGTIFLKALAIHTQPK